MRILLVRPIAPNERFGLGPFFRVEPLGMEYVGAALEARGHAVSLVDLRFSSGLDLRLDLGIRGLRERALDRALDRFRPDLVGVAAAHTLETNEAIAVARAVKRTLPGAFVVLGGHAAAVHPAPFEIPSVDAICCEDGEQVIPLLADALSEDRDPIDCPGLRLRAGDRFVSTKKSEERVGLDLVPLPARHLVKAYEREFLCLNFRPVQLVETARGCPYRCSFCTIWRHVERSYRCRDIAHVVKDLASVGPHVFLVDDLFFHPIARSRDLARTLLSKGVHKRWALVQTRTDLVARHPDLLEEWRPFAHYFDIFFGFESPTNEGLSDYSKDSGLAETEEAVAVCKRLGFGITGNFIIDPDWTEDDFRRLWDFIARLGIWRAGFTIMTPLPGTPLFDRLQGRILERDWSRFDMHHLLWEPRLGRRRFFELFAECWKRTVLNARGDRKRLFSWLRGLEWTQVPTMARVLLRTQRMMDPEAYLRETFAPPRPAEVDVPARLA